MKKIITLCAACLLVLSGCTGGEETATSSPAATEIVPPTASPLVVESPLVTPTVEPVETTAPVETDAANQTPSVESETSEKENLWDGNADTLTLNDFPTQLVTGPDGLTAENGYALALIAQLPESDTWLYGVAGEGTEFAILRVGEQWRELDIIFTNPQFILPQIYYGDFDGDMTLELAILSYLGTGTVGGVWDLNVVEFGENGSWTVLPFDPSDYMAILDQSIGYTYDPETNVATLLAGESILTLNFNDWGYPAPGEPITASCGEAVSFTVDGDTITGSFSVGVNAPNVPLDKMTNVAKVRADVVYTGSAFGLDALAFYGTPDS